MAATTDWLTSPTTAILFNGTAVGKSGGIEAELSPAAAAVVAPGVASTLAISSHRVANRTLKVIGPRGVAKSQLQAIARSIKGRTTVSGPEALSSKR